jgi:putative membrane protein
MIGFGGGFWGMIFVPIVLALIAYVIYYLVAGSSRPRRTTGYPTGRALEILKERYARGEITREQYLKMHEELERPEQVRCQFFQKFCYVYVVSCGFQRIASIPPIIPRSKPIPMPPMKLVTLTTEKIMINVPHSSCFSGLL